MATCIPKRLFAGSSSIDQSHVAPDAPACWIDPLRMAAPDAPLYPSAETGIAQIPAALVAADPILTMGLVAGIELGSRPDSPGSRAFDLFVDCFEKGLLIRVTGDIVALSPPLIVEPAQIDEIVSILGTALRKVA